VCDQLFRRTEKVSDAILRSPRADKNRPNSKAHLQTLNDRIAKLESLLKEEGQELPGDVDKVERAAVAEQTNTSAIHASSPESNGHASEASEGRTPSIIDSKQSMVKRLLSTRGHLSFDQLSGRLRYFGPTTNCHIYSELNTSDDVSRAALEQRRRTEKVIRSLSAESNDYLMDLYWRHYNAVIHVIHQAAFEEDKEHGRTQYYSGFLHICMLAMAYQRFADKSRPDMMRIGLPMRESTLHKEAKYMLDCELEQPGGIPSIQALLLLGDLECGVGRDNLGWLYAGMANRLCFDVGLHLDNQNSGLQQREIDIGRMTLWACVIYDKYWALFLGRPTSLKSADLAIYNLSAKFERLGAFDPTTKTLETQIYEALIDLMELAGKITDMRDSKSTTDTDHSAYLRMAALDRELGAWYSKLPKPLQWIPENINTAPFSFFLLHQQYHCTMILLHRPFALYDDATSNAESDSEGSELDTHFSALSRTLCTKHAVRVARIFWQHRQRFDTRHIFVTGLQHAGTAAIALVAALAYIKDRSSRAANMQYLECLAAALHDMTETYHPAERMSMVLEAVMVELRANGPGRSVVPARRDSSSHAEVPEYSSKRRQLAQLKLARNQPAAIQESLDHPSSFDGFVVITPQTTDSTNVEGLWPNLSNNEESTLDYPMSSYRDHFFPRKELSPPRSAWMGAETPQISRPATAFAENFRVPARENESEMDFGAMLHHGSDWPRTDLDGWPPLRGAQSPPKKGKTVQSQAETMSGLHEIWDEMMRTGGSGVVGDRNNPVCSNDPNLHGDHLEATSRRY
jgi:Fungal specific transcription factor domain